MAMGGDVTLVIGNDATDKAWDGAERSMLGRISSSAQGTKGWTTGAAEVSAD